MESSFVGTGRLDSPQTPPVFENQPTTEEIKRLVGVHPVTSSQFMHFNGSSTVDRSFGSSNPATAGIVDTTTSTAGAQVTPRISTSGE